MAKKSQESDLQNLPVCAADFIELVISRMRYRKKVRLEVRAELAAHFEDELADCKTAEEKEQKAERLIADFGDAKLLAILLRRAKKRCRPLWRTAVVRCFQAISVIVIYAIICSMPLFIGRPTIRTSYLDLLNATIQRGSDPNENAQLYYDKAAELLVEDSAGIMLLRSKWPGDFNDTQRAALVKLLADSKPAIDLLRQGVQKPLCWRIYDANLSEDTKQWLEEQNKQLKIVQVTKKFFTQKLLERDGYEDPVKEIIFLNESESLSKLRQLAYRVQYQILYEVYIGDVNAAVADCITLHKFPQQKEGKGLLVEQMVMNAIDAMAIRCAFTIMKRTDVSADELLKLQKEFEQSIILRQPVINFGGEKVSYLDIVQRCFTDDGKGDGRMLIYGLPLAAYGKESLIARFLSMRFPSRRETLTNIETFYKNENSRLWKTPWELHNEGAVKYPQWANNIFLRVSVQAYERIGQVSWRVNCHCKAVITTAAILRYKKEKGVYPANLEELAAAGYLKELPMDPYSDKPLVYKKTGDGFILYSVGPNFKDDGGQVSRWIKPFVEEGDRVFWPASE